MNPARDFRRSARVHEQRRSHGLGARFEKLWPPRRPGHGTLEICHQLKRRDAFPRPAKNYQTGNNDIERRERRQHRKPRDLPREPQAQGYGSEDAEGEVALLAGLRAREMGEIKDADIASINPLAKSMA